MDKSLDFSKDDWMESIYPGTIIDKFWREIFKVENKPLGVGSFANVYLAETVNGKKLVIKQIKDDIPDNAEPYVKKELEILKRFKKYNHPNILKMITWF